MLWQKSKGKAHGVTKQEAVEIVTQLAFYCGWPKAWSTFSLIREVYGDDEDEVIDPAKLSVFPLGQKNDGSAQYFIGQSYLAPLSTEQVPVLNVTFEPGCRNNWHIHHASSGGGQRIPGSSIWLSRSPAREDTPNGVSRWMPHSTTD